MRSRIRAATGAVFRRARSVPLGSGSAYTGPLDLLPGAVVAWDQRAASAAKLGTSLYTLVADRNDTTTEFNSNINNGAAPFADIAAFKGSAFNHTGEVTDLSSTIILADSYTDVSVKQAISGADIPANAAVDSVDSLPSIAISAQATGSNPAEVLTFAPNAFLKFWTDQSANGYINTDQGINSPTVTIAGDNIPKLGAIPNYGGTIIVPGVVWLSGARTYLLVFDYVQGSYDFRIFRSVDVSTQANFQISVGVEQNNDVVVQMTSADGGTSGSWATSNLLTTGRHLLDVIVAANGVVTVKIDTIDAGAVLATGTAVSPEATTADVDMGVDGDRYSSYCVYSWNAENADAAIANIIAYYNIP